MISSETAAAKFRRLSDEWRRGRASGSDLAEAQSHSAYQRIIGMGMEAVPLILRELRSHADHWFEALYLITEENPVRPESRGKLRNMAADWIAWGKDRGIE